MDLKNHQQYLGWLARKTHACLLNCIINWKRSTSTIWSCWEQDLLDRCLLWMKNWSSEAIYPQEVEKARRVIREHSVWSQLKRPDDPYGFRCFAKFEGLVVLQPLGSSGIELAFVMERYHCSLRQFLKQKRLKWTRSEEC
jgi:hypothetical protein